MSVLVLQLLFLVPGDCSCEWSFGMHLSNLSLVVPEIGSLSSTRTVPSGLNSKGYGLDSTLWSWINSTLLLGHLPCIIFVIIYANSNCRFARDKSALSYPYDISTVTSSHLSPLRYGGHTYCTKTTDIPAINVIIRTLYSVVHE